MKIIKRFLVTLFSVILSTNFVFEQPVHASSPYTNFYIDNKIETVNIDGITYAYYFYYENGNRAITITNDSTNNIDTIVYDEVSSTIYLNTGFHALVKSQPSMLSTVSIGWETLSKSSDYISWEKGTSVAIIAGMIAIYVGTLGPAGVIAAMGTGALSVLAASSVGGTVYVEAQMFSVPLVAPQYRYIWSFKASTGDKYGPYIYNYYT